MKGVNRKKKQYDKNVYFGNFEEHLPRRVRSFRSYKTKNKDEAGLLCTVEWYADKEGKKPEASQLVYEEVRSRCPKLLVDYYERHLILI